MYLIKKKKYFFWRENWREDYSGGVAALKKANTSPFPSLLPFVTFNSYSVQPTKFIQMDNTWGFWWCCILLFLNWATSIFKEIILKHIPVTSFKLWSPLFWWKGKEEERVKLFKQHHKGTI